jgi:NAD(P)-dependent dehydrogenase (short-subunit alcohol dehydrogenase family)
VAPSAWSPDDIGDQTGRVALVTGANSGIGFETARALADHGAHVIMGCRDPGRARVAADKLEHALDRSSIELLTLDLSDLVAVRRSAERFLADHARLDLLDFDDVAGEKIRNTWSHYGNSKLANLLFTAELSRRLQAAGEPVMAVAAHPGWTRSNLIGNGAAVGHSRLRARVGDRLGNLFGQSAAAGAGPSLYAATSPDVAPGQFIGPSHLVELFGPPKVVRPSRQARNLADASRLWEISEELTGIHYRLPAPV